jgi:intraflagellar transport protein 172
MIFANGELTLIEYAPSGRHGDNILCTVRTEFLSPNLISVRVEERHLQGNKKMAYLLDSRTIGIVDLMSTSGAAVIDQVNHDANINWLALNETSRYLLFRDKNLKLYLYIIVNRKNKIFIHHLFLIGIIFKQESKYVYFHFVFMPNGMSEILD